MALNWEETKLWLSSKLINVNAQSANGYVSGPLSPTDYNLLLKEFTDLYFYYPKFKEQFDEYLEKYKSLPVALSHYDGRGNPIPAVSVRNSTNYDPNKPPLLAINLSHIDNKPDVYFSANGELTRFSKKQILAHEFNHLLTSSTDPNYDTLDAAKSSFEHLGDAVKNEVIVLKSSAADPYGKAEMARITYTSFRDFQDNSSGLTQLERAHLKKNFSYTEYDEKKILMDIAYRGAFYGNDEGDMFSFSDRDTKHLIIGLHGGDTFYGGRMEDYIYGGEGKDTLYGGTGANVLHGGIWGLDKDQDGYDTADYGVNYREGGNGTKVAFTKGIEITIDSQNFAKFEGRDEKGINVKKLEDGTVDRLFSIEIIKGTDKDDILNVKTFDFKDFSLSKGKLEIRGGAGKDTADFRSVKLKDGEDTLKVKDEASENGFSIHEFEIIYGSVEKKNDLSFTNSTDDMVISGGTKDDIIKTGSGDDKLTGGLGKDELHGGRDYDTYHVGTGDTILDSDAKGQVFFGGQSIARLYQITELNTIPPEVEALAKGAVFYI